MDGREYFNYWEKELQLDKKDAVEIQQESSRDHLKRGTESRRGGRLSHLNLTKLTPAEIEDRRERSTEFLQKPRKHFDSEEDSEE